MSTYLGRVITLASKEVGVREEGGANCGPRVEEYLRSIGLPPGNPWCCAFLYFVFKEAALDCGVHSIFPLTGKVATLWRRSAMARRPHPFPGAVFVHLKHPMDPDSVGHCGIVADVAGTHVLTIEGNSNQAGSREGDSVVRHQRPTLGSDYIAGYLDFDVALGPGVA